VHTQVWLENPKGRDHSGPDVVRRIILEWMLGEQGGRVWIGFIWLGVGTSGGLL